MDLAVFLVENGARTDTVDGNGKTPLDYCLDDGMAATLMQIRTVRVREESTQSLIQASSSLDVEKLKAILQEGMCNPNVLAGPVEDTLLHTTLKADNLSTNMSLDHIRHLQLLIVQCLISHEGSKRFDAFCYLNKDGLSAFHVACKLPSLGMEACADALTDYLLSLPKS